MEINKLKGQTMQAQDVRLAIAGAAANTETLLHAVDHGIDNDGESMLAGLATIDAVIFELKKVRLAVLRHERALGTSWNEIQETTGTHASTWRFRHDKGVLGT